MCGANRDLLDAWVRHSGSSPRVRGERSRSKHLLRCLRIIPACAGRTHWSFPVTWLMTDHPRVCGANAKFINLENLGARSSPRVRGERRASGCRARSWRIIPACAGRTALEIRRLPGLPDHPRVCGANSSVFLASIFDSGSSPRVRGERRRGRDPAAPLRIIPACAGRTPPPATTGSTPPDHPRVCGANPVWSRMNSDAPGSSPRVRGELCHCNCR